MKMNSILSVVALSFAFSSLFVLCQDQGPLVESDDYKFFSRKKPSQDFKQFLTDCGYGAHCAKYLREKYPQEQEKLDAILFPYYKDEYRRAIADLPSKEVKLVRLERMENFLTSKPHWIDDGNEPCLFSTNDGSDRGTLGLRFQALKVVKKEIEDSQE